MPMVSPTLTATRTTVQTITEYVDTGASGGGSRLLPKGPANYSKSGLSGEIDLDSLWRERLT